MNRFSIVAIVFSLIGIGVVLGACPARADDEPIAVQADGGSTVTTTDGGSAATVDLGTGLIQTLAIRCEGAQSTRYHTCTVLPCAVTLSNQLLDSDRTFDIPLNRSNAGTLAPKRYLTVATDDAGTPLCKVQNSK